MSKYVWKCEKETCRKEFTAKNPNNCPECGGDEMVILQRKGPETLLFIMAILVLVGAGLAYYYWPKDEGPKIKGGIITYELKVTYGDNYFEINGGDDLVIYVEDKANSDQLFSIDNKFYPCDYRGNKGDYDIKWEKSDGIKVNGETQIRDYKFKTDAHKKACDVVLTIDAVNVNPNNCTYTIMTNMDANDLEVSLEKGKKYIKGKIIWTYEEAKGASYFYVRAGDQNRKIKKVMCTPPDIPDAPSFKVVVESFNLFIEDVRNNREQFTELLAKYLPIVNFNGEDQEIEDFIMWMRNQDNPSVYSINKSGIIYSPDGKKIIKLNIKKQ